VRRAHLDYNTLQEVSMKKNDVSPVMLKLSQYISEAVTKPVPKEVSERAKLHLIDTFAAMISGSRLEPGVKAIQYIAAQGGTPQAGIIGTDIVTTVQNAALANGMLGHADETDDTHPPSSTHPGTAVVPAALAIGERDQLSGEEVLRGIIVGYDVGPRMLLALRPVPYQLLGHHAASAGGLWGAAGAAASLSKLTPVQVRYALSYTGQQHAGLYTMFRDPQHIEKAFAMGGMSSHNGLQAAAMAACGWTGVEDIFSGERDFFHAYGPEGFDREALTRGLGENYEMMRASIKRWPIGGPIQGPMHVLHDLMQEHRFQLADVDKVIANMPDKELMIVDNRPMPDICVQHLLAIMLIDGELTFRSAHNYARMDDPKVLEVRSRMHAVPDASLTDVQRRWRCVMEVHLKNGTVLKGQTMSAKGSFENPLSPDEENAKALDLIVPILGKERSQTLLDTLWNFENISDVRSLRALYRA
jgi:2-methylcitrate dehydratase PrpD